MAKLQSALLYTALCVLANAAAADMAAISDLRDGDMRKLNLHSTAQAGSDAIFYDETGEEMQLLDHAGKFLLVNFWATWCAPCRKEMPQLSALQTALGDNDFQVLTIATGRNPQPAIDRFFDEIAVDNLPKYTDPRQTLARELGVLGLPVTIILDREGMEIGRLQGDADWASESALAILSALKAEP